MSTYSSIRAASNANTRTASLASDRARISSTTTLADNGRPISQSGRSIIETDRRSERRSPFRPVDPIAVQTQQSRENVYHLRREDDVRGGSVASKKGGEGGSGVYIELLNAEMPCTDFLRGMETTSDAH